MKINPRQIVLASIAIVLATIFAQSLLPRVMMARSSDSFHLGEIIPNQFGEWTLEPNVRLVEPEPDGLERQLYSQEVAYGYRDREGRLVMLLIAYGPNQSSRLQLHRPEICYVSVGFRVSPVTSATISYREDKPPLNVLRLTAMRDGRREAISYWMRIGDTIANDTYERQMARVRLLFNGKIADGALVRVSTVGLPDQMAYEVQDRFVNDLLRAIEPENVSFFVGDQLRDPKLAGR
jgi:EpsI family protein